MRPALPLRRAGLLLAMLACLTAPAGAQNAAPSTAERSYPYPLAQVKQSLQQLGAYAGGRLPMLDGFVASDTPQLDRYQRPYYQYRIELNPVDANHTSVKVEAKLSAWYADTDPSRAGYRSLTSNGHLENDLLDQLQDALSPKSTNQSAAGKPGLASSSRPMPSRAAAVPAQPVASPAYAPDARQQKLDDLLAEKLAVEQKTNALKAQILHMEQAARLQTTATQFASVKHTGTGVMSQMNYGGPVLFRTRAEDEFEVVEKQGEWVRVRLGPDSTGWIASEGLNLPEEKVASRPTAQSPDQSELGFWVSREQINEFSGEWPQLQGKKVLFVFAQSRGLLPDLANDDRKLVYAKKIFADRYRASTLSQDPFEGVVVIFMGGKGGVAAATLADIKQWVKGSLGEAEFVKRCSLDPPGEFQTLRKTP